MYMKKGAGEEGCKGAMHAREAAFGYQPISKFINSILL
jgi:hypothetical protein